MTMMTTQLPGPLDDATLAFSKPVVVVVVVVVIIIVDVISGCGAAAAGCRDRLMRYR